MSNSPSELQVKVSALKEIAQKTLDYLKEQAKVVETVRPLINGNRQTKGGIILTETDVQGEIIARYEAIQLQGFISLFGMYLAESDTRSAQFLARTVIEAGVERPPLLFGTQVSEADKIIIKTLFAASDQGAGAFPRSGNQKVKAIQDLRLVHRFAVTRKLTVVPKIAAIVIACETANAEQHTAALEDLRKDTGSRMGNLRKKYCIEDYPSNLPFKRRTEFENLYSTMSEALHGAGMTLLVFTKHRTVEEITFTNLGILTQAGLSMSYWVNQFLTDKGKTINQEWYQELCDDYNKLN